MLNNKTEVTISALKANVMAFLTMPLIAVIVLLPYGLIWGWVSLINDFLWLIRPIILISGFVVSIFAHEALHGIGFVLFGHASWKLVEFGFQWKALSPYAHCSSPMMASSYRGSLLLPGLILGIIPAALGVIFGLGWLSIYGVFMLILAGGDFIMLWVIRRVPAGAKVIDHAERPGCWVLTE